MPSFSKQNSCHHYHFPRNAQGPRLWPVKMLDVNTKVVTLDYHTSAATSYPLPPLMACISVNTQLATQASPTCLAAKKVTQLRHSRMAQSQVLFLWVWSSKEEANRNPSRKIIQESFKKNKRAATPCRHPMPKQSAWTSKPEARQRSHIHKYMLYIPAYLRHTTERRLIQLSHGMAWHYLTLHGAISSTLHFDTQAEPVDYIYAFAFHHLPFL